MSAFASPIDRLYEIGGQLWVDGEKVKYRIPPTPEARALIEELKQNRDAIAALLKEQESRPPTLAEIRSSLPPGVRLVSYRPKEPPFAVAPISIVTNAGKFYRAYLRDLKDRLEKPEGYHCPPLADILSKLADAGLELRLDRLLAERGDK